MSAARRLLLAGAALVLLVLSAPAPAFAHATLTAADPESGAVLEALPDQIVLTFSAAVKDPALVTLTGPDGESHSAGEASVDGARVSLPVQEGPDGSYTVAYRAFSRDGHLVTGSYGFVVGEASASATAGPTTPTPAGSPTEGDVAPTTAKPTPASAGGAAPGWLRWGVPAGLVAAGGLLYLLSLTPRRSRPGAPR